MKGIDKEQLVLNVMGYLALGSGLLLKRYYPESAAGTAMNVLALVLFIKAMFLIGRDK